MRLIAVILAVLLAAPAWAQDPPLDSDVPRTVQTAVTVEGAALGPGTWLSPTRAAYVAAKQTRCEDDKKQLQDALEKKPTQAPESDGKIVMAATLAGAGGVVVGALAVILGLIASGHIK